MEPLFLLVSSGIFHPSLLERFWLRRALAALPGVRLQRAASLEALPRLALDSFQVLVLYYHHETVSPAALEALDAYVREGGGLLAVHAATASFKEEMRYFDILGGRFVEHGPVESFAVRPVDGDPVFGDVPPFAVRDELYHHEMVADVRVRLVGGIEDVPVVWTRQHERGRVCYCMFGHTVSAVRHPQVQEVLRRGLAWACVGADGSKKGNGPG